MQGSCESFRSPVVQDYAIRVVQATHQDGPDAPGLTKRFVRFGALPRGAQAVLSRRALFPRGRLRPASTTRPRCGSPALHVTACSSTSEEAGPGIKTDQVIGDLEVIARAKTMKGPAGDRTWGKGFGWGCLISASVAAPRPWWRKVDDGLFDDEFQRKLDYLSPS
jgi:hypothetical protein